MPAPRVYRTEAVVLKGYDYGEADRILTLYTSDSGKLRAIAKGVRRTKSRMSGHVDLFTRSHLLVARGRQLDIVTQADTVENFRPIRDDLWRFSHCHYVAELVDGFTAENLANFGVYALTVTTLRRLAIAHDLNVVTRAFELQLLSLVGYRPQLHRCLNCDALIVPGVNYFSAKMGGVLCAGCVATDRTAPPVTVQALKMMRNLQTNESAMLQASNVPKEIQTEVEHRLLDHIMYRLEARPRSIGFLQRLRSENLTS